MDELDRIMDNLDRKLEKKRDRIDELDDQIEAQRRRLHEPLQGTEMSDERVALLTHIACAWACARNISRRSDDEDTRRSHSILASQIKTLLTI